MLARIAAFVAAVAMVAGALYVRGRADEGEVAANGRGLTLVCVPELELVCRAAVAADDRIELTVEPAAATRARLLTATAEDAPDAWLTLSALGQAVDEVRVSSSNERLFSASTVVARSPLVAAIWKPAADALRQRCPAAVDWKCVAGATNEGVFRLGTADPSSSEGLTVLTAFGAALLGDPNFFTNDLDDPTRSALLGLKDRTGGRRREAGSLLEMVALGPAVLDGYVTTEANAGPTLATAAAGGNVERVYLAPPATADVHLASRNGAAGRALTEDFKGTAVAAALRTNGFWVRGSAPPSVPQPPPLPTDDGLPSPGVFAALQEVLK